MNRKLSPTLIGAFVLGAVAIALAAVALFGSGRLWRETRINVVYFSGSVKGLTVGSPVMFRGVPIGQVRDIRVICDTRDLTFRIPVLIETEIDKIQAMGDDKLAAEQASDDFIRLLVKRGLRAQLQMQSLVTGQLFVQLDFFPDTTPNFIGKKEKYQEIPSVLSNYEEVSRTLEQIPLDRLVQKVMNTLDGIDKLVNSHELADSLSNLNEVLKQVKALAKGVNAEMGHLVSNVSGTMAKVGTLAEDLDGQIVPVSSDLRSTLDAVRRSFGTAESALKKLDTGLSPQAPERTELRQALQEIAAAARAVRVLADAIDMQPEMLLKGRQGGE